MPFIAALQPLGVEAALAAQGTKDDAETRLAGSALAEAHYHAEGTQAQFDAARARQP